MLLKLYGFELSACFCVSILRHSHVSQDSHASFTCSCPESMIGSSIVIIYFTSYHTNKTQTTSNTNSTCKSNICDRAVIVSISR